MKSTSCCGKVQNNSLCCFQILATLSVDSVVYLYLMQLDTSDFMEEFGLPTKTRTKDGYNPLLDDFKNTKFYLSVPTHNIKQMFNRLIQVLAFTRTYHWLLMRLFYLRWIAAFHGPKINPMCLYTVYGQFSIGQVPTIV